MASTTTIQVVREYLQDTPKIYSVQQVGNPQTKQDIAEQLLSVSLSSPHLGSYTFDINQPQGTAIVRHNRPSHDRLMDTHEALRQLQKQVAYLQKKDEERDEKEKERDRNEEKTLEWEVFSRIAQAINDEIINDWRSRTDCVELVQALERHKIHFLPYTMTAEAISWRTNYPDDNSVFPIERFYSDKEREAYIKVANRNEPAQQDINKAWELLEEDKSNLVLMLTSWAKRGRGGNGAVHMIPSAAFAERCVAADDDFRGEVGNRARYFIQCGQDSRGERLFM